MTFANDWHLFKYTWLSPKHSLFFYKQYWKRFWYRKYFSSIEKYPLTLRQRQAIIVDEQRNLVIAGAGTGKTSTVVGKVGYLVKSKKCKPEEILIIAYNRNASIELRERLKSQLNADFVVGTFHSIGKSILNEAKHPSRPHEFVDQEEKLLIFLQGILNKCLKSSEFAALYQKYFQEQEFKNVDEVRDFKTEREYANWVRSNKLLTLNNENVRSHGELLIANFLFVNGIKYKYEAFYSPNNLMPSVTNYRPDFYLPDFNLYIEYFGIDEDGNTASYIDRESYNNGIKWKFQVHRDGNTKLVDLYYHQKKHGVLQQTLSDCLRQHGVKFNPIDQTKIFEQINDTKKDARFLKLVMTFLTQYKERQHRVDLNALFSDAKDDERTLLFLRIFQLMLNEYQQELSDNRRIDFGDMISQSARMIKERRAKLKYRYIIIDEFQDISDGRYGLINEMLLQNPKAKLFCVGDDWQAIYRFAGSNHQIMTNFSGLFGVSTSLKLDETFRYNNRIAGVSERFVTSNPSQIKKDLKTFTTANSPQVFVHWHSDDVSSAVLRAINVIKKEYDISNKGLLILSRYNHTKFDHVLLGEIQKRWNSNGKVEQRTIHSSKGLESDFVLVADLKSDQLGFPSDVQDDPLLSLVLAKEDPFADSEERRLFYVALTRARHQVHLICDAVSPSRFADELTQKGFDIVITGKKENPRQCPACTDGVIVKKSSGRGDFFSCVNYPVCDFKPVTCPTCQSDIIVRTNPENAKATCLSEECDATLEICNACPSGVMIEFQGRRGSFLGCHDYRRTNCKNTRSVPLKQIAESFSDWVSHFESFIGDFHYSDTHEFFYTIDADNKQQMMLVSITYLVEEVERKFMNLRIDLGNFSLRVDDSSFKCAEYVPFEYDQDAFLMIENEISHRRIELGLPEPE